MPGSAGAVPLPLAVDLALAEIAVARDLLEGILFSICQARNGFESCRIFGLECTSNENRFQIFKAVVLCEILHIFDHLFVG